MNLEQRLRAPAPEKDPTWIVALRWGAILAAGIAVSAAMIALCVAYPVAGFTVAALAVLTLYHMLRSAKGTEIGGFE